MHTLRGILLNCWITSAAYLICVLHSYPTSKNWIGNQKEENSFLELSMSSDLEEKPKTYKAQAQIINTLRKDSIIPSKGEILLYFTKNDSKPNLKFGDHILIPNTLQSIQANGNPGGFDYKKYCESQNIFHSKFLTRDDWQLLKNKSHGLAYHLNHLNQKTRNILKLYIHDPQILGIAEALLIGYRKDVDQETWQAYSNTGIVHIIAISGLHMAMVYTTVRWLLLLIPFFKNNKRLALVISILFMWLFAAITGLPPSVSRAAVMFTFIGIGEMTNRKIPIYNNLAASALFLLCINPFWLFDVGFQLSYLALISLVLFYEPIYHQLFIRNKVVDAIWKLLAGTLAAQILTFPICMYYFHQFPLLFLITNLIAVPASTIILYLEILLVFFSWIPSFAKMAGWLVSTGIECLNAFVYYLSKFSFSVWNGIQLNLLEFLLLFLLVIFAAIAVMHKHTKYLLVSMLSMLTLGIAFSVSKINTLTQQKIIIYNISKQSVLQLISGNKHYSPDYDRMKSIPNWETYTYKPATTFLGLKSIDKNIPLHLIQDSNFIYLEFCNKSIVRTNNLSFLAKDSIYLDYLILSKGVTKTHLEESNIKYVKHIILDSSIPLYQALSLKSILQNKHKKNPYVVVEKGAWIVDL